MISIRTEFLASTGPILRPEAWVFVRGTDYVPPAAGGTRLTDCSWPAGGGELTLSSLNQSHSSCGSGLPRRLPQSSHHTSRKPNCIRRIGPMTPNPDPAPARSVILPAESLSTALLGRPRLVRLKELKFSQRNWSVVSSRLRGVLKVNSFHRAQSAEDKPGPLMMLREALPQRQQGKFVVKAAGLYQRSRVCPPGTSFQLTPGTRSGRCPQSARRLAPLPPPGETGKPDSMVVIPLKFHPASKTLLTPVALGPPRRPFPKGNCQV